MMRLRASALAVALSFALMPAHAAGISSTISVTPEPNELGWHKTSVTVTIGFEGTGSVTCSGGVFTQLPDGSSQHGDILHDGPIPIEDCGLVSYITETSIVRHVLTAAQDGSSAVASAEVRVDMEPPVVAIDSLPVVSEALALSGTVEDNFSGPLYVALHFENALGTKLDMLADCAGCGVFPECHADRDPPCGAKLRWTFDGPLAPGLWTVTPFAVDLALNLMLGSTSLVIAV